MMQDLRRPAATKRTATEANFVVHGAGKHMHEHLHERFVSVVYLLHEDMTTLLLHRATPLVACA